MPINEYGMNSDYVSYFSIEEYVDKIKLLPRLLDHLESTNRSFDDYMKNLSRYDEEYIINYWIYLLYEELRSSQRIEGMKFNEKELADKEIFFESLEINHKRIHELHNFATDGELEPTFEYRRHEVNVSRFTSDGKEEIFWRGSNACDVNRFMNDFIKLYKKGGTSLIFSNPFLVSGLMHLIFLRIHPYMDGNGRTSRIIHNIKFTESINKLYGTRLKLSPLNLSQSILINKITYTKRIDNIYFDLDHDTNESINMWFNFILDMADEQIFSSSQKLDYMDDSHLISNVENKKVSGMRLSRLR
ncbi:MAG: Fic family protein [Bacilli bacterium]